MKLLLLRKPSPGTLQWNNLENYLSHFEISLSHWELVMPHAQHNIRSLLSMATNTKLHKRFFSFFPGCSSSSQFSCQFVRHLKNDCSVQEVEQLDVNLTYAHLRYSDGCESTMSLHDPVPCLP